MKRFCVLLLAILLMAGMCSCAKPEEIIKVDDSTVNANDNRSDYEKAVAFVEKSLDVSKMSVSTQDESDGQALYCTWFAQEEQPEFKIDKEVTLADGQKIVLGTTIVKEVKEMGFTYEIPDEILQPDMMYGITLNKDDKWVNTEIQNSTGSEQKAENLPITSIDLMANDSELSKDAMSFDYCGIKTGATIDDIIKALGVPNSSVHLSTEMTGCRIELSYGAVNASLSVNLKYDPATDTATFVDINLHQYTY